MEKIRDNNKMDTRSYNWHFSQTFQKKIGEILSYKEENNYIDKDQQNKTIELYKKIEREILETYNINKKRAQKFIQDLGLKNPCEMLFLTDEHFYTISESIPKLKKMGSTYKKYQAVYNRELELPIVFIDRFTEKNIKEKNIIMESNMIHEILHYNSGYTNEIVTQKKDQQKNEKYYLRKGFLGTSIAKEVILGLFFEEWWVRMYQAKYKTKYHTQTLNNQKQEIRENNIPIWYIDIKEKTKFKGEKKELTDIFDLSWAAIELLVQENPVLENLMLCYRKWQKDKYKDIVQMLKKYKLINWKSLYKELRKLQYYKHSFEIWYNMTKEAIENYKANNKRNIWTKKP